MDCPKCVGKLQKITVRLDEVKGSGKSQSDAVEKELMLDQCFVCNGVWFDVGELDEYIEDRMTAVNSPAIDDATRKDLDSKIGKCPRCNVDMVKKRAPQDAALVMDVCEQCQGIWLDNTEIDKLEKASSSLSGKISAFFKTLF